MAWTMASMLACGRCPLLSRRVPSMSSARSRIMCRGGSRTAPTSYRLPCEVHAQLGHHLAFEDVAERVLLHVVIPQVDDLEGRREAVGPLVPHAAVDQCVGLGRAGVTRVEHVLPERGVAVAD